jgi:hypothetical protein
MTVTLTVPDDTDLPVYGEDSDEHPFLRRWHSRGTLPIEELDSEVHLEDGLRVRFGPGRYYKGDYWMLPVRAGVGGGAEELQEQEGWSEPALPHGVSRHYAPLAVVSFTSDRRGVVDCRRRFRPLGKPYLG